MQGATCEAPGGASHVGPEVTKAHSLAQRAEATCPHCDRPFSAGIWPIVDAAERPDLLARVRNGALHALTCPHCGEPAGQADAPLLLCRPGVSSVITGATRVAQIEDNARAASISLPEDVVEQIEVILENRPE